MRGENCQRSVAMACQAKTQPTAAKCDVDPKTVGLKANYYTARQVVINCITNSYTLGGTIAGLTSQLQKGKDYDYRPDAKAGVEQARHGIAKRLVDESARAQHGRERGRRAPGVTGAAFSTLRLKNASVVSTALAWPISSRMRTGSGPNAEKSGHTTRPSTAVGTGGWGAHGPANGTG